MTTLSKIRSLALRTWRCVSCGWFNSDDVYICQNPRCWG